MATAPNLESLRRVLSVRQPHALDDPSLTPAGVLLLLYPKSEGLCVLLTKRTSKVEHHKGEVSFPGGARDPEDATILQTALRETSEEVGVAPEDVEVLGELDEVATRTRFAISSFVGLIPYPYRFMPSEIEVAEVLEVPLSLLLNPRSRREELFLREEQTDRHYAYAYEHHIIFGATARILTQFLELLDSAHVEEIAR